MFGQRAAEKVVFRPFVRLRIGMWMWGLLEVRYRDVSCMAATLRTYYLCCCNAQACLNNRILSISNHKPPWNNMDDQGSTHLKPHTPQFCKNGLHTQCSKREQGKKRKKKENGKVKGEIPIYQTSNLLPTTMPLHPLLNTTSIIRRTIRLPHILPALFPIGLESQISHH